MVMYGIKKRLVSAARSCCSAVWVVRICVDIVTITTTFASCLLASTSALRSRRKGEERVDSSKTSFPASGLTASRSDIEMRFFSTRYHNNEYFDGQLRLCSVL